MISNFPASILNTQSQFPHDTDHAAHAQITGFAALTGGPACLCQLVHTGIVFCGPPGAGLFEYSGYQANADWSCGVGGDPVPSLPHAHPESAMPGMRARGIRRRGQSHSSPLAQISRPQPQSPGGSGNFIAARLPLPALPDVLPKATPDRATACCCPGIFPSRLATAAFSNALSSAA